MKEENFKLPEQIDNIKKIKMLIFDVLSSLEIH